MTTRVAIFDLKIVPMVSYGLLLLWTRLTLSHLRELKRVKTTYLKQALGAHRRSSNRLVYLLARCEHASRQRPPTRKS